MQLEISTGQLKVVTCNIVAYKIVKTQNKILENEKVGVLLETV